MQNLKNQILEANKYVHSQLVEAGEYTKSPHFLPENREKVRNLILEILRDAGIQSNQAKMLDFGCGTGFVIDLTKDLFQEIHGIDITPEMMKYVDVSSGNVFLHECEAEATPFEDSTFMFATAYSFMDHLYDYKLLLKEAYRVLQSGGVFYADLNPNSKFINNLSRISEYSEDVLQKQIVKKELKGALNNGSYYSEKFGISSDLLELAEPVKTKNKGFDLYDVVSYAKSIGFSKCQAEYDWYVDEGSVIHKGLPNDRKTIDKYLREILPISEMLFKYIRFVFTK